MDTRSPGGSGTAQARPRLGELLVRAGSITPAQLERAIEEQRAWGGRLGQILVDHGVIAEATLAEAIASQLSLRAVDLDWEPPRGAAVRLVPLWVAERYGLVALDWDPGTQRIEIACTDPTSNEALREVRRTTGLVPVACIATASQIDRAIRRHYYGEEEPGPTPHPYLQITRTPIPATTASTGEAALQTVSPFESG